MSRSPKPYSSPSETVIGILPLPESGGKDRKMKMNMMMGQNVAGQGFIANGVKSAASGVFNAVKSVASGIASFLHFSVPDEGPLADADTYMPDFMKLLEGGIRKDSGSVIDRTKALTAQIREKMSEMGDQENDLFGLGALKNLRLPKIDLPMLRFPEPSFAGMTGGGTTNNNTTNHNKTTNLGGVHITVNGYNARNDDELARVVADKINGMISEDDAVFK